MIRTTFNPQKKIWCGSKFHMMLNPDAGLGHLILNVLKNTPELVTQVSDDTKVEVTCYEMRDRAIKMSSYLNANGYKQGHVVGFIAKNSENIAPVVFACFALGLPVHVLSTEMNEVEIVSMYSKTKPKLIICDADIFSRAEAAVKKLNHRPEIYTLRGKVDGHKFVDDILSNRNADDFIFPELENISSSIAIILCSSGTTTGKSKAICKSHKEIILEMVPFWNLNPKSREVYFNSSSLFWVSGFITLITATLYGGKRIITTDAFSIELMIDIFQRHEVTTTTSLPTIIAKMLQLKNLQPMKSMRAFLVGGTVVSEHLCKISEPYLPNGCCPTYGTSEGSFLTGSYGTHRFGSAGQLLPNVEMKIVDVAGKHLGPNEKGEICYRREVLFSGYLDDPEETDATIKDGWVHSSDIGYLDNDGFVFIVDRKPDLLTYNCANVLKF